jgi:hypothetical protein
VGNHLQDYMASYTKRQYLYSYGHENIKSQITAMFSHLDTSRSAYTLASLSDTTHRDLGQNLSDLRHIVTRRWHIVKR